MEEAYRPHARAAEGRRAETSDAEVVRACAEGAPEAFQELLTRYRRAALTLAYQMLGDSEEAEDVAQEAFVRVFQAVRDFRGEAAFSTWLYRIVANLCLGRMRKRRPCLSLESVEEPAAREAPSQEVTEALAARQVLTRLPAGLRAVLVLREEGDLSYQEIATALALPVGTVRSRLSKARSMFREIWTELLQSRET